MVGYSDRYIKTKCRKYVAKAYTNFLGLDVPEDGAECKPFRVIFIYSLLAYDSKY